VENRIVDVCAVNHSLDPARAEVRITVTPLHRTPTTEVRGRLMGPSCAYASTVEVAYPLTPLRDPQPAAAGTVQRRVVIPEPSLWDPQSPYLYAGPVELWQDGQLADRVQLRHGLRQFNVAARGLRVNGKPLVLRGISCDGLFPEQIPALRVSGCNALVVPLRHETLTVWETADRYGFLVLGRLGEEDETETARLLQELQRHPSCLGWLANAGWLDRFVTASVSLAGCEQEEASKRDACGYGIEVGQETPRPLPSSARFVVCRPEHVANASCLGLPLLGQIEAELSS
jgi:hypothetical protein